MDLSIIIVNYNTRELTRKCLNSIIRNINNVNYEIIVIDNASIDGSTEIISREFSQVKLIYNNDNVGFAKASNQGIKKACGRFILLLNSDTIVLSDSVKLCIDFVNRNHRVGVLGCAVLNSDQSSQFTCYRYPNLLTEIIFFVLKILKNVWDPFTYFKWMSYWDHMTTKEVDCLAGCFMLIRRDIFDKIGLLNEHFFMYYEDAEFCWRIHKKSEYKVVYYPLAKIIHLGNMSMNSDNLFKVSMAYRSARYFFELCYGKVQKAIFVFICKSIWRVELLFLFCFRDNKKCNTKFEMIKTLLYDDVCLR